MKKSWMIALVVVVLVMVTASTLASRYNRFVAMDQSVQSGWSQVENVLQRRADLIPNLVSTVQAMAEQEQAVFIKVAEARSQWQKAGSVPDKMTAANAMQGALLNLMATIERYPEIKSNTNFMALQDELAGTENRIAVERRRYNELVESYNTFAKSFPNNLLANVFSMPMSHDFFKADEGAKTAPKVEFKITPQADTVR